MRKSRLRSSVDLDHLHVLERDPVAAHAPGHPGAREDARRVGRRADAARSAVEHRAVAGARRPGSGAASSRPGTPCPWRCRPRARPPRRRRCRTAPCRRAWPRSRRRPATSAEHPRRRHAGLGERARQRLADPARRLARRPARAGPPRSRRVAARPAQHDDARAGLRRRSPGTRSPLSSNTWVMPIFLARIPLYHGRPHFFPP